jgi:hypothetical protein
MPNPKPIQITISAPCSQPWEQMTPDGQGRHCAHCSKTVVDFTTWGDAALYNFFSQNTDRVCGRFFATQLSRPLCIPPQPHSRLYRMTIALGLTLIFTQATEVVAQNKAPRATQSIAKLDVASTAIVSRSKITGRIKDEFGQPQAGLIVQIKTNETLVASNTTDEDGRFSLKEIDTGNYSLFISYRHIEITEGSGIDFRAATGVKELQIEVSMNHAAGAFEVKRIVSRYQDIESRIYGHEIIHLGETEVENRKGEPPILGQPNRSRHYKVKKYKR